ncbi:hypothetical protein CPB83DRAFT_77080 [Crepidotus variabilis]|uniref:Uncharacterized protein n=1 Tax=Crepidotus variabilis TaxID=179855 RepID=A0A9P6EM64_9AGAR|nr:hypothetical protein CPB83DRAFT_77080 [Crepidotus variabilis]
MTLSKRHPLRLLLPSELSQNAPEEITYPHAVELSAQTYDSSDDSASHLPTHSDPELKPTFREPLLPTFRSRHSTPHDDAVMYPASGSLCGTSPTVFGQSLPFSTPGPGSAVTARSIFSVPSPQSGSSPTLCHPLSHHEDGQRHPAVTELYQPSIAAVNPYYHFNDQADYDDSGPALADLPDNPYVSSVYSTPGPTFCAPFFHFDSPTEDPLTPAAEDLGSSEFTNVLDLNEVGFHWAPFDRKQIIAPSIPETQAFRAHGTSTASRPVRDSLDYDKSITPTISHNGTSPHDPVAGDNTSAFPIASQTHLEETTTVKPPVSPSPFRFSPSVTDYQLEPVVTASESDPIFISPSPSTGAYHVPESQGQPQVHRNSSQRLILKHAQAQTPPPQNIPFAPRPGVYISPIEYSPKESTKPRTAENGKDIQASLV